MFFFNKRKAEKTYTDEELIQAIRSGDRDIAWEYMFKNWMESVVQVIKQLGGSRDEAFDAFQDVYMSLSNRFSDPAAQLHSASLKTYVITVVKNRYVNIQKLKKKDPSKPRSGAPEIPDEEEGKDLLVKIKDEIRRDIAYEVINNHISKRCRNVIIMYLEGKSMKEIAEAENWKDADKAKKEKYECVKKLIEKIHGDPVLQQKLKDLLDD